MTRLGGSRPGSGAGNAGLDRLGTYIERQGSGRPVTHDLRVERAYDAAPEVVFDAFTDPRA